MARITAPAFVVGLVNEWAGWRRKVMASGLGFPSSTPEARFNTGGKGERGAIVPNIPLNRQAAKVDRLVRDMALEYRDVLEHEYFDDEQDQHKRWRKYCVLNSIGMAEYESRLDKAYLAVGEGYAN